MKIEALDIERIGGVIELSLRAWAPVFDSIRDTLSAEAFAESYPDGWEASQARAVEEVCLSSKMRVWTVSEGEGLAAFVAVRLDHETKTGEIYMIAVDPVHQKKGIASALTEFAVKRMRESGMVTAIIETGADPGHEPARRTYEKAGFTAWPSVKFFKTL